MNNMSKHDKNRLYAIASISCMVERIKYSKNVGVGICSLCCNHCMHSTYLVVMHICMRFYVKLNNSAVVLAM